MKLRLLHEHLAARHPFVERIAVATYDETERTLRAFVDSTDGASPLLRYAAPLAEAPSLREILTTGRPRVVNDLAAFDGSSREHTERIRDGGFRASYTFPMALDGKLWGFLFFNSRSAHVFTEAVLPDLDLYAHLVTVVVTHELVTVRVLAAALATAMKVVRFQDPFAGAYLDRVATHARLLAEGLRRTGRYALTAGDLERLAVAAPLYVSGPGGPSLPVDLFLPSGTPERAAYEAARRGSPKALEKAHSLLLEFFLGAFPSMAVLRRATRTHDAAVEGRAVEGDGASLEARVVALADVVEALGGPSAGAPRWSLEAVVSRLHELAASDAERDLVRALESQRPALTALWAPRLAPYSVVE